MAATSLTSGWLPIAVGVVASVLVGAAALPGRGRPARWRARHVAAGVLTTIGLALTAATAVAGAGALEAAVGRSTASADGTTPPAVVWAWAALGATAAVTVVLTRRPVCRPVVMLRTSAVPAAALCALLVTNQWSGYVPTVASAWAVATDAGSAGAISLADATALRAQGTIPPDGRLVRLPRPAVVHRFVARQEYAYLPPGWFVRRPSPLPVVVMIGAAYNAPGDWVRAGLAVTTARDAAVGAATADAPILVFADSNGSFTNDTECVNGPRGAAADHLVQDLPADVVVLLGADPDPARWAVAGFSAGGTCAVTLAVGHPERFGRFVDIGGDAGPNLGPDRASTIADLYGGDARAWARDDPLTVLAHRDRYRDARGLFYVADPGPAGAGESAVALRLCGAAAARGIGCAVRPRPGEHTWAFAASSFRDAYRWLLGELRATPSASSPGPAARS